MKKTAIVYWSGTGNTEKMAEYIAEGVRQAGGQAELFTPDGFTPEMMEDYDTLAFGCPSMGAEELEPGEFAPMFEKCAEKLSGKRIALFGSYGWGDGEWMRTWEALCEEKGAVLMGESIICCGTPDETARAECVAQGEFLTR